MFVKENLSWLQMLFRIRGSSFKQTWPRVGAATGFAVIVTAVALSWNAADKYTLTAIPFELIGIALGIFLGFRNNAAYDRFWEGRNLWGSLIIASRNVTRQAYTLLRLPEESLDDGDALQELEQFREKFVRRLIALSHALRHHLRGGDPMAEISEFVPREDLAEVRQATNRPVIILQQLGRDLAYARSRHWIHELSAPFIDNQLAELSRAISGCERIRDTPIPFGYTVLIHRIVASYCFSLPFGLLETTGMMTPVVVVLISYAFFGLDAIGDELEQPFGTQPNDLPLAAICRSVEINLLELIKEPDRPEPLVADRGILL